MRRRVNGLNVVRFLGTSLGRRDWVYLLGLLLPLIVYDLALKAASVLSQPGLSVTFDLMQSAIFFNLGYALLWIGLFAAARKESLRRAVVLLFHAATILVVLVTTSAYQYFKETGTTLDYGIIALWLPNFEEVVPIIAHGVTLSTWLLLFAALFYATLGPWLATRVIERWRGGPEGAPAGTPETSSFVSFGLLLLAFGLVSLSPLTG